MQDRLTEADGGARVRTLRAPRLSQSEKEVFFEAGQQQVIEFLQAQFDETALQPLLSE